MEAYWHRDWMITYFLYFKNEFMKFGLVTFYDDNFGTLLQAFALQHYIEKLGLKIPIIKYHRSLQHVANESIFFRALRYKPLTIIKHLLNRKAVLLRKKAFDDFRNSFLYFDESEDYYRDSDLSNLSLKYDVLVCGSDMMWSAEFRADWKYYMLGFMPKKKSIAYSPSFGKNSLSSDEVAFARQYLNGINYLSCRESKGVELLDSLFGLNANLTVDPTLLLIKNEWQSIINDSSRLIEEKYILTYSFLGTKKHGRQKVFNQLNKISNLVILSGAEGKFKKYEYKGYAGPIEFLKLYRDSSFIVTDTFHGMLFAIIFEKPFVVLDKSPFGVSADRLRSTLHTLGLEDRYITNDTIIDDKLLHLDYTEVNKKLQFLKEKSFSYLYNSLHDAVK